MFRRALTLFIAIWLLSCSGVGFEREPGVAYESRLSRRSVIAERASVAELPQPAVMLGRMVAPVTKDHLPADDVKTAFKTEAWRYGCDALADLREDPVAASHGLPAGFRWSVACVRTARAVNGNVGDAPYPGQSSAVPDPTPHSSGSSEAPGTAPAALAPAASGPPASAPATSASTKTAPASAFPVAAKPPPQPRPTPPVRRTQPSPRSTKPPAVTEVSAEDQASADYKARRERESSPKVRAAAAKAAAAAARQEAKERQAAAIAAEAEARSAVAAERAAHAEEQRAAAVHRRANEAEQARLAAEERAAAEAERRRVAEERQAAAAQSLQQAKHDAAEQARLAAASRAAAEVERQRQADDKRVADAQAAADAERAIVEAKAKAAAERAAAAAAAEKATRERAAAEAKAAEGAVVAEYAAAKATNSSGSWATFLSRRASTPQAVLAHVELQRAVVRERDTWLTIGATAVGSDLVEVALAKAPESLRDDLKQMRAQSWRILAPRDISATWTLRNPVGRPMLVAMSLAGQRFHALVPPGPPVSGKAVALCLPDGAPAKEIREGVLDYKYGCKDVGPLKILGAELVEVELAADKHACDTELSLEALAQLMAALPASWLSSVWADRVDDAMADFASNIKVIKSSARSKGKPSSSAGVQVDVNFRSAARFDATVFYTVGTGRVERLLVQRGKSTSIKLETEPGRAADLQVLRLMPRLRAADWLYGAWRTTRATIAILPGRDGAPVAMLLSTDEDGHSKLVSAEVGVDETTFRFSGSAGVDFARRLLGDTDTLPLTCQTPCEVRIRGEFTKQERFEADGRRYLYVSVEVGNRSKTLQLEARN